jgi:hypothetical protein
MTLLDRLQMRMKRRGWSVCEYGVEGGRVVVLSKGERRVVASGKTQREAWRRAFEQVRHLTRFEKLKS